MLLFMYTTFTPQTRALNILANQMIFFSLFLFFQVRVQLMYSVKEGLAMLGFVNALEQHPTLFFSFMRADPVENICHM